MTGGITVIRRHSRRHSSRLGYPSSEALMLLPNFRSFSLWRALPLFLLFLGIVFFGLSLSDVGCDRFVPSRRTTAIEASAHSENGSLNGLQHRRRGEISKKATPLPAIMRVPIDWREPSQDTPYPQLGHVRNLWIRVKVGANRTYVMSGNTVVYTLYSSAGVTRNTTMGSVSSATPIGTFSVQEERGESFYNPAAGEGANWWVSWKGHGVFLFHSVPVDRNGRYEMAEAGKLGREPASHGCVRLSVPDAKWFYDELPVGTRVVIEK